MNYQTEHFFIVNFGIRDQEGYEIMDNRQTQTFSSRKECEQFIIQRICDVIIKAVNTEYEINKMHEEYFTNKYCDCCDNSKIVFKTNPSTIREARLLAKTYIDYYPSNKSYFAHTIHEHKPE
jgi:hypothetical protein